MNLGLDGKMALVTGASSGLGFALARELAHEGASLIICSRDEIRISKAALVLSAECRQPVLGIAADTSYEEDVNQLFKRVRREARDPDILIVNSGGPPAGPFESHASERWTAAIDQHLGAALHLVRECLPAMRLHAWGRILTVTSMSLKQPAEGMILSNTARAALLGFAKTLANEVASFGITVNNLMPGYTRTDRIADLAGQLAKQQGVSQSEIVAQWEDEIPMRRLGTPEELAALGAFLCSTRASYITGTSIPVDGGWIRSLL